MYDFITIGDAVVDTHLVIDHASLECDLSDQNCKLCLEYGAKIPINDSFQSIGGNAANVAVGLSELGIKTTVMTTIGDDVNGNFVREELKKKKIDTTLVGVDAASKTRYSTILNYKGERTILSYHKKRNYVWPTTVPETSWIYYTSLSDGFENIQNKLVSFLKKHPNVKLAFNPGTSQIGTDMESVLEIIKMTDVLILNLQEAEKILGTSLTKEKSMRDLVQELKNLGAKEVVITDGKNGAWAGNEENVWHQEIFPIKVVAKTGAGDAFSAGYLSAKYQGLSLTEGLRYGTANSTAVVSNFGSQNGLLDPAGMKKMLTKFAKIKPIIA